MKIILLAGGSGTRLWPMTMPPKIFSQFLGKETLYQKTIKRFLQLSSPENFVIVTKKSLFSYALEQAKEIDPVFSERIIVEKETKNTLPALLFALQFLEEKQELDSSFLVAPCDHLIAPEHIFLEKIRIGTEIVENPTHLLFGVFPTYPHTGYGYIQCNLDQEISKVESFIEKPSLERAKKIFLSNTFLWNTGIFLFHTELFWKDLTTYQPELFQRRKEFDSFFPLSIDHGLLEFLPNLHVISLPISWSDVGCWESVYDAVEKNGENTVSIGNVEAIDTKNCLIYGNARLIRTVGVKDLIIVDSPDGLLVAKKQFSEKSQDVSLLSLSK